MPRDATATRAQLLRQAERLFARRGLWQVTVREITEAAGQRNVSALHYHFGSRAGVCQAILESHGAPIDAERGELLAGLGPDPSARDLVVALLVPYSAALETPAGRDYLRIVAQLTHRFAAWETDVEGAPNLVRILRLLRDSQAHLPPAVRAQRTVAVIQLMTIAFAERARALESRVPLELDDELFLTDLADVLVAAFEAPMGEPISRAGGRDRSRPSRPPTPGRAPSAIASRR